MTYATIDAATAANLYPYLNVTDRDQERTSEQFTPISTLPVMETLENHGFKTYKLFQDRVNKGSPIHARHMVCMVSDKQLTPGVNETAIIMNAGNGTKSLQVAYGALRGACFNTLFFGDVVGQMRVIHSGTHDIQSQIETMLEGRQKAMDWVNRLKDITPTQVQRRQIAGAVRDIRPVFEGVPDNDILYSGREADAGADLFTAYNVAQENLIRGGSFRSYRTRTGITRIKPVKSSTSITQINTSITQEIAAIAA